MIKRKILLIDDDPDDRVFFTDALHEINNEIKCNVAENGEEALKLLSSPPLPDLIFLDLNMPVMNGLSCLFALKKDEKLKSIPVIIYTTTSDPETVNETKSRGAVAFLKKPNDYLQFIKKLKTILEMNSYGDLKTAYTEYIL